MEMPQPYIKVSDLLASCRFEVPIHGSSVGTVGTMITAIPVWE